MKAIKKNLKDEPLHKTGRVMYCRICGGRYSASSGDYFDLPDNHVFRCCKEPMVLGRFVTKFVEDKGVKS